MNPWAAVGDLIGWIVFVVVLLVAIAVLIAIVFGGWLLFASIGQYVRAEIARRRTTSDNRTDRSE